MAGVRVIHSDERITFGKDEFSIFLAGPTPRRKDVKSWRPEAIQILTELGYEGAILVPERADRNNKIDYICQVGWEDYGLTAANLIVFWVPRDLETMPAFTTNVEAGRFFSSDRSLYGRPDDAPGNRYLDWLYGKERKKEPYNDLREMLKDVVSIQYWVDEGK